MDIFLRELTNKYESKTLIVKFLTDSRFLLNLEKKAQNLSSKESLRNNLFIFKFLLNICPF